VLLHEAGHRTLFGNNRVDRCIGHLAGFVTLIPFHSWQRIHACHHRFTGWQDLDATTASLVPRRIRPWEAALANVAWRTWLPLFSVIYRIQNYWNRRRIALFVRERSAQRAIGINVAVMIAAYAAILAVVGPAIVIAVVGPALILSLAAEDILLLSQHTHLRQQLSGGKPVRLIPPHEQAQFTRSLRLPRTLSALLMHFDLHGLHHMYPRVPGYLLSRIAWHAPNEVAWIPWIRAAKNLSGVDFLFRHREDTGAAL
jgi:fatty acid desaturase